MNEQRDEDLKETELGDFKNKFFISSRKKWFWVGILISLLNPIFAGFIIAAFYLSEPGLKKEGRIVATVAILWGAVSFYLLRKNIFNVVF